MTSRSYIEPVSNKAKTDFGSRGKYFWLKSHNKLQITLNKNKILLQKRENFGQKHGKHGILAKSRHLTKITVSVISVFP